MCAALARPEDANSAAAAAEAGKKPAARAETLTAATPLKRVTGVPAGTQMQDTSLPNVSEDVLDKALNDRRFVQRQLKCATGEGPCDPIGRKIKGGCYTTVSVYRG